MMSVGVSLLDGVKSGNVELVSRLLGRRSASSSSSAASSSLTPAAAAALASTADADGSTALHWSAWVKQPEIFTMLLASGASVNQRNSRGESVLEWAIRGGSSSILSSILLSPNVDLRATNDFGGSAAHIAAEEGAEAVLIALLLLGAPIDAADLRGKTPLHCAAHRNRPGALQWLLRHGADPGKVDEEGASALHYAAIGGNEINCDAIIKAGMAHILDVPAFAEKLTPPELADKYGQVPCAAFLRRWKMKSGGWMNRTFIRMGLDRPRQTRPFLTFPQIYFYIGITLSLYHFHTVLDPQLVATESSNLSTDATYHFIVNTLWFFAILGMIGMGGFMYLDPGLLPKGPKLTGRDAQSADGLVAKSLSGMPVCAQCRIVKTIRSKHCEKCGGCVARMDHHCPWVNRCVGLNNHRSFFAIIVSMIIAAGLHSYLCFFFAFTFAPSLPPLVGSLTPRSVWDEKLVLFLMIHSGMIVVSCVALLIGQSWTVATALTTNEAFNRMRYAYLQQNGGHSPFDEGRLNNCLTFWGFRPGKSFVRHPTTSFAFGTRSSNAHDIILEMESRPTPHSVAHGHSHHGHSHGGQTCHGHGGPTTSTDANAANNNNANNAPTGNGANMQAVLHSHHHHQHASTDESHLPDQDPECAYFHGSDEPPIGHTSHHLDEEHAVDDGGESAGLISGKDKHH